MTDLIQQLPKAELHVHLEGTFEPEHIYQMAQRNSIDLGYESPQAIVEAYDFHDLPSFLSFYYAAMNALQTEQDFYDLTYAYFEKVAAENVVYVEPFFDPQGHTSRGVAFDTVIRGIHRAQLDAEKQLGVQSNLIMCFLRDMSADSALEHLQMALPYKDWIIGVGLDSDEKDNPPSKFAEVFERARAAGFKLTMHCDVNQKDIVEHMHETLDLIAVDRIDHGINSLDDPALIHKIKSLGLGLTVCPVSNHFVVQSYTTSEIRAMLKHGLKVTINSDDPAYFGAYLNDNFRALVNEAAFSSAEIATLVKNAFEVSWLSDAEKTSYLNQVDGCLKTTP
ncbi:adenosine deaminase [Neiella marina]|uniref:Adenine deaminase n=1 Tax=Neiella holothuriorum TaxID=2870530 RepID=A0ABS7EBT5_9GAMM|nr:adenosine deaminase [Neiella holothuriorum]MBW8189789.1 adenosine deaminase [Neiella holothuriorum]